MPHRSPLAYPLYAAAGDDEMVKKRQVHFVGHMPQPGRDPEVRLTRLGITAWVVVDKNETRGSTTSSAANNLPEIDVDPADGADAKRLD